MRELRMPQLALGAEDVVLSSWRLEVGEAFAEGDVLAEIETDKAQMEVEAPWAGVLVEQAVQAGDTVPVGAVYARAVDPDGDVDAALRALAERADGAAAGATGDGPGAAPATATPTTGGDRPPAPGGDGAAPVSDGAALVAFLEVADGQLAGLPRDPRARRWPAAANGAGAGSPAAPPAASAAGAGSPAAAPSDDPAHAGPYERRPLTRRRQAIARRMAAATGIPAFVVTRDVDAEPGLRAVAAARADGHAVTFTDVLLRALGVACAAHPAANAWMVGDEAWTFNRVGVALAVDADGGVSAPVVRGVESLGLLEIAAARADLVARARAGTLTPDELTGATVTLSNVAGLGAHAITPVLTAPQAVAVGVGSARPTAAGKQVTIAFVGDHRLLDGADGARYLETVAQALARDDVD